MTRGGSVPCDKGDRQQGREEGVVQSQKSWSMASSFSSTSSSIIIETASRA